MPTKHEGESVDTELTVEQMRAITHLDIDLAKKILRTLKSRQSVKVELSGLQSITEEAAVLLSKRKYISLGLPEVSPSIAAIFVRGKNLSLTLDRLQLFSPETALAFRDFEHVLTLNVLQPDAARILAAGKIDVIALTQKELSLDLIDSLSEYAKDLNIGIENLNPETAAALARCKAQNLDFSRLESLHRDAAKELIAFQGDQLAFEELRYNASDALPVLLEFKNVFLAGQSEIGPTAAERLASSKNDVILVTKFLSLKTAETLAKKTSGMVSLVDLAEVEDGVEEVIDGARHVKFSVKTFEVRVSREKLTKGVEGLPPDAKIAIAEWLPFFRDRRNFKDLVVEESKKLNAILRRSGVEHPEVFQNLNAKHDIRGVVAEFINLISAAPKQLGTEAFLEKFERRTGRKFSDGAEFLEIYKDEIIQIMADNLHEAARVTAAKGKADQLPGLREKLADPKLPGKSRWQIEQKIAALEAGGAVIEDSELSQNAASLLKRFADFTYVRPGKAGFALASRQRDELTLGDKCSDCTSATISGMNFFTVPTWLTDPGINFLLQYDEKGNLAHKFTIVWEITRSGEIILTVDSAELGNSQKQSAGMYEGVADLGTEKRLMNDAIRFIQSWADTIGIGRDRLFATTISNTGTDEFKGFLKNKVSVAKFGGVTMSRKVAAAGGVTLEPQLYLQSCKEIAGEDIEAAEGKTEVDMFNAVEFSFRSFLDNPPAERSGAQADYIKLRSILELASVDPKKAAKAMRIFLILTPDAGGSREDTKRKLCADGKRLDQALLSAKSSFERYFEVKMGGLKEQAKKVTIDTSEYSFTDTTFYHLAASRSEK